MDDQANPVSHLTRLLFISLLIGVIGGLGAVVFRYMIGFIHNLFFNGQLNFIYDANKHVLHNPWGIGIIFVPVIGAVIVTWLVKTFAPEAKGHGVPEVVDAIYYQEGRIRPIVALVKSIASSVCIGTGGSVGREGPIIQIGAAFGSTVGQWLKLAARERIVLIAAGASAGIAATFNAPIGGVLFSVELLLVSISASTLAIISISTVTATYIGRFFLGLAPAFDIPALALPDFHLSHAVELLLFIPFGVLAGAAAALFTQSVYKFEDWFDAINLSPYWRHMIGMLLMGVIMYAFFQWTGHYYVQGIGYSTIDDILKATLANPYFLLLLFAAKLVATSLTLGSGGSGGVFSPALFMGATLGAAFGGIMAHFFPTFGINPLAFAMAGMAAIVGGSTGAVLTAITMLFEMTRDYNDILPLILTVGLAYVTRQYLSKESIYTMKILRRGRIIHEGLQAAMYANVTASDLMHQDYVVASPDENLSTWMQSHHDKGLTVVAQADEILGSILGHRFVNDTQLTLREAMDEDFIVVNEAMPLREILRRLRRRDCEVAFVSRVADSKKVTDILGVITNRDITHMIAKKYEMSM